MPPKKGSRKSGNGAAGAKTAAKALRETVPRPYVFTPPRDPPTIVSNPVRRLAIDLFVATSGTAGFPVSLSTVRTQLLGQIGLPVTSQMIQVRQIAVWVTANGGTVGVASSSQSLKMVEPIFGIEARDDPSPMENARVGIIYPGHLMPLYPASAAGTTTVLTIFPATVASVGCTVRITADYWSLPV